MSYEKKVDGKTVRVVDGDLTLLDVESFVFYATPDLKLGTGYGNMVSLRGGPKIQEELNAIGETAVGNVAVTTAGKLKANCIIHAVGPAFEEEQTDAKLRQVMENTLKAAEEKGVKTLAFPPMGTGFYGIDTKLSATIMAEVINRFLAEAAHLETVTICVRDPWEKAPYETALSALS
jgi:O-acetyl-ADP-ribose deacetylase (regulator of RNase III)